MNPDIMPEIEAHMQTFMGLHGSTISDNTVRRAVQQRITVLGLSGGDEQQLADYLLFLQQSEREVHQLSELLVVPETWFFRYHQSFQFIEQHAKGWLQQYGRPLRILSLPCATGEEPYSIAMSLLDAGLSTDCFRIDAVDISGQALKIAQQAEYGSNSFRHDDLAFRQRYCTQKGNTYRINAQVRSSVHFANHNIMQDHALPGGSYALVFCRNLLIYFDTPTQQKVLKKLSQLLYSDGLLFVGHADTGPVHQFEKGFEHLNTAAFVYRKASLESGLKKPAIRTTHGTIKKRLPKKTKPARKAVRPVRAAVNVVAKKPVVKTSPITVDDESLSVARKQADAGELTQALAHCQRYLRQHGNDADAWALLGIIHAVESRQTEALKALNKAIYLDPSHEEALTHLALMADQQGQGEMAMRYRQRLMRLSQYQRAAR